MNATPPVCNYEGSDYQATFWDSGQRAYEDQSEALALKALLPARGQRLLEIGAGAGRNTPRYAGFNQVVVMDYARSQVEQARARLGDNPRYVYVVADVYRLPFVRGAFDAATMIRVIHHLAEAPAALRQIHAALQPGGTFILEFANKRNLKAVARWLLRRQAWNPFTPEPVEFVPLNFDFHPRTMQTWVREAGFVIEARRALSYLRLPWLKRLAPTRLLVTLDGWLQPTGQWTQWSPSVFLRARAPGVAGPLPQNFFKCPACGNPQLRPELTALHCPACERAWPIREGIYELRM